MDKIMDLVDGQLDADISNLAVMEPGSEAKSKEVENIVAMLNARTEAKSRAWDIAIKIAGVAVTLTTFGLAYRLKKGELKNMWEFETNGTASTIPQIRDAFDMAKEQRGSCTGMIWDMTVKFATSQKPGDKSRYPVVSIVLNHSEENIKKVKEAADAIKLLGR